MNKLVLAYTAGLFDGEGSVVIGVSYQKYTRKDGVRSKTYKLFVGIDNTDASIVQWLKDTYGGSTLLSHKNHPRKPLWAWRISSNKALAFLVMLKPYLRIKKAQSELAISFQAKRSKSRVKRTDGEVAIAEAQRILMHSFNSKAKKPLKIY